MTILFVLHIIVVAVLVLLYLGIKSDKLSGPLAVVIAVMCMSAMFWSISMAMGTTNHSWAPWIAIAAVTGSYCFQREK